MILNKKILFLTDHRSHIIIDSFYELVNEFLKSNSSLDISVASRAVIKNKNFFEDSFSENLYIQSVEEIIDFGHDWEKNIFETNFKLFDVIILRIDQPISLFFLNKLQKEKSILYINNPLGMIKTNDKSFLKTINNLTPNIYLLDNMDSILELANKKEIVIKPLNAYGGKGISRIYKNSAFIEDKKVDIKDIKNHIKTLLNKDKKVLVMNYLKNVYKGDKRIIIVNDVIIGAMLRIPNSDSWICNLSQGATTVVTNITKEEIKIINYLNPIMKQEGIIMYGIDTLENNEEKRVLSEINTANVGGFSSIEKLYEKPVMPKVVKLLIEYIEEKLNKK